MQISNDGYYGKSLGSLDPTKRTVQQRDISNIFKGIKFENGRAQIGRLTNSIYDKNHKNIQTR